MSELQKEYNKFLDEAYILYHRMRESQGTEKETLLKKYRQAWIKFEEIESLLQEQT